PGTNPPVLILPNCTSWNQNTGVVCSTTADVVPGSPSKCSCNDTFTLPIFVETGSISVLKTPYPLKHSEPGGPVTFTVNATHTAQYTQVTLGSICDDQFGTVVKDAAAALCANCKLGNIASNVECVVPQPLAAGASYSCKFTANLGPDPEKITDTVTV